MSLGLACILADLGNEGLPVVLNLAPPLIDFVLGFFGRPLHIVGCLLGSRFGGLNPLLQICFIFGLRRVCVSFCRTGLLRQALQLSRCLVQLIRNTHVPFLSFFVRIWSHYLCTIRNCQSRLSIDGLSTRYILAALRFVAALPLFYISLHSSGEMHIAPENQVRYLLPVPFLD